MRRFLLLFSILYIYSDFCFNWLVCVIILGQRLNAIPIAGKYKVHLYVWSGTVYMYKKVQGEFTYHYIKVIVCPPLLQGYQ